VPRADVREGFFKRLTFTRAPLRRRSAMMARQAVRRRHFVLSSALVYAKLNRQSSGRGGRANCFDRLPLPAMFEAADDCLVRLALVTRLFFPSSAIALTSSSIDDESFQDPRRNTRRKTRTPNETITVFVVPNCRSRDRKYAGVLARSTLSNVSMLLRKRSMSRVCAIRNRSFHGKLTAQSCTELRTRLWLSRISE